VKRCTTGRVYAGRAQFAPPRDETVAGVMSPEQGSWSADAFLAQFEGRRIRVVVLPDVPKKKRSPRR